MTDQPRPQAGRSYFYERLFVTHMPQIPQPVPGYGVSHKMSDVARHFVLNTGGAARITPPIYSELMYKSLCFDFKGSQQPKSVLPEAGECMSEIIKQAADLCKAGGMHYEMGLAVISEKTGPDAAASMVWQHGIVTHANAFTQPIGMPKWCTMPESLAHLINGISSIFTGMPFLLDKDAPRSTFNNDRMYDHMEDLTYLMETWTALVISTSNKTRLESKAVYRITNEYGTFFEYRKHVNSRVLTDIANLLRSFKKSQTLTAEALRAMQFALTAHRLDMAKRRAQTLKPNESDSDDEATTELRSTMQHALDIIQNGQDVDCEVDDDQEPDAHSRRNGSKQKARGSGGGWNPLRNLFTRSKAKQHNDTFSARGAANTDLADLVLATAKAAGGDDEASARPRRDVVRRDYAAMAAGK